MNGQFNREEFLKNGFTSFHAYNFSKQTIMLAEIDKHKFNDAPVNVGKASQYFKETDLSMNLAPKTTSYIKELEEYLKECLRGNILRKYCFNEHRVQVYGCCKTGISVHKDRGQYHGIIVIIVLEDGGDFFVYDEDRNESTRKKIYTERGYVIVMKANRFKVRRNYFLDQRLPHAVVDIKYPRTTIGLRFNAKASSVSLQ